jgi:hypothetical protein
MVTISKSLVVGLVAAITVGTASFGAHAADTSPMQVFKAARGVSLDVGSKKVAGYFVTKSGACDVTLMFADRMDPDGHVSSDLSRLNVPVKTGNATLVYTSEGRALELACGLAGTMMTVRPLAQTADVSK